MKHAFQGAAPQWLSQKAGKVVLPFLRCISGQFQCTDPSLARMHNVATSEPYSLSHLPDPWWLAEPLLHLSYYQE